MIGLDTNVVVRYVMQDDAKQSALATKLVESLSPEAPGFLPLVAIVELSWVLGSAYALEREEVATALEHLLSSKEIVVEQAAVVWQALRQFKATSADLADCLIARSAATAGCETTMTFDRAAAKSGGMTLLA